MQYTTSDIAEAAFLFMKGLKIISATRKEGKFSFTFDDKLNGSSALIQEYIKSEYPKYDAAMRRIKKMLYNEQ
jgi:hypothetical protein